jgi:hypothetical protein
MDNDSERRDEALIEEGFVKNRNPEGNWFDRNRTNESLRLGYLLLWNFAQRLDVGNPEKLDEKFLEDLMIFKVNLTDSGIEDSQNYEKLMVSVHQELNYFVNGTNYPGISDSSALSVEIKDAKYLDQLALTLGGLDGVVGFILSGNQNCSIQLLSELHKSSYSINLGSDSTKSRVEKQLLLRNS